MTLPCCLMHSVLPCCCYDAKTIEYTVMDLSAQVDRNLSATAATLKAIFILKQCRERNCKRFEQE